MYPHSYTLCPCNKTLLPAHFSTRTLEAVQSIRPSEMDERDEYYYRSLGVLIDFRTIYGYAIHRTSDERIIGPKQHCRAPYDESELFVGNLPHWALEDTLITFFRTFGEVYKMRVRVSEDGARTRGKAFVTFVDPVHGTAALEQIQSRPVALGGNLLTARRVNENKRIFIGGVPEHKRKEEVWHELTRIGMKHIVDIIMYRSYNDRNKNRGFVFVEFANHAEASLARNKYKSCYVFGQNVHVDWSTPLSAVEGGLIKKVRRLFLRHLSVVETKQQFQRVLKDLLPDIVLEKVYKFRDYAFIHFKTRRDAQRAKSILQDFYKFADVDVYWAKPSPKLLDMLRRNEESDDPEYMELQRSLHAADDDMDETEDEASVSPDRSNSSSLDHSSNSPFSDWSSPDRSSSYMRSTSSPYQDRSSCSCFSCSSRGNGCGSSRGNSSGDSRSSLPFPGGSRNVPPTRNNSCADLFKLPIVAPVTNNNGVNLIELPMSTPVTINDLFNSPMLAPSTSNFNNSGDLSNYNNNLDLYNSPSFLPARNNYGDLFNQPRVGPAGNCFRVGLFNPPIAAPTANFYYADLFEYTDMRNALEEINKNINYYDRKKRQ